MAEPILPSDASPLVRIRKDAQTRSVWSVHLPGWLEKGWWPVAGAVVPPPSAQEAGKVERDLAVLKGSPVEEESNPGASAPGNESTAEPTAVATTAEESPAEEPRPRRGRRKAAAAQKPEETTKPEPVPTERESKAQAEAEQPTGAESQAEVNTQTEPDSALAAVAGLPEDLFDDPLA